MCPEDIATGAGGLNEDMLFAGAEPQESQMLFLRARAGPHGEEQVIAAG